jgi:hypothetical protein
VSRSRVAATLAALLLLSSCATVPPAPMDLQGHSRYDADRAACRAQANASVSLRHTLDSLFEAALLTALVLWGWGHSVDGVRDGAAIGGLLGGASAGLRTLEHRQQVERRCMLARGHTGNGPAPSAAGPAHGTEVPAPPPITHALVGEDSFNAAQLARAQACAATPQPALVAQGPGFEHYRVGCDSGDALAIRCEFGQCRVLR